MCAYSCSTKPITKTCRFTTCAAIPVITTLSCLGIEVVVLRLGYFGIWAQFPSYSSSTASHTPPTCVHRAKRYEVEEPALIVIALSPFVDVYSTLHVFHQHDFRMLSELSYTIRPSLWFCTGAFVEQIVFQFHHHVLQFLPELALHRILQKHFQQPKTAPSSGIVAINTVRIAIYCNAPTFATGTFIDFVPINHTKSNDIVGCRTPL